MTLGGLALAVGILVDDATVAVENIHRNMGLGKSLVDAVLDGAQQIAVPAFVSTLAICIVFVPVLLLTGTARFLFTPLALAVVFAMVASYLLSRTLVPTMVHFLLHNEATMYQGSEHAAGGTGIIWRVHYAFNPCSKRCAGTLLGISRLGARPRRHGDLRCSAHLHRRPRSALAAMIGRDFFPKVDSGHAAPARARSRRHAHRRNRSALSGRSRRDPQNDPAARARFHHRRHRPAQRRLEPGADRHLDHQFQRWRDSDLAQKDHAPTALYERRLRKRLAQRFPDMAFFFQAADITGQILNFGIARAARSAGLRPQPDKIIAIAQQLAEKIACIPGAADVHVHQVMDYPVIQLDVDRSKAVQLGHDAARRQQQHADLAERQLPDFAAILGELGERRELQRSLCRRRNTP